MLKRKWQRKILDFYVYLKKRKKTGNKILITTTDGIGDFVIRLKLFNDIGLKFGFDNCYVLCDKKIESIVKKIGFSNIIIFTKKRRSKLFGKISLLSIIFKIPLKYIISLEFDQHDFDIQYFNYLESFAYKNKYHPEMDKYYSNLFLTKGTSVEEFTLNYYNSFFKKNLNISEIIPDLKFFYSDTIIKKYKTSNLSIGIGAGSRKKMISPNLFAKIINIFWKTKKFDNIFFLGNGKRDEDYWKNIKRELNLENINSVYLIGKLDLNESISTILNSDAYLGFDSGLFHIAASLGIKTFGLFSSADTVPYSHKDYKNVITFWGNIENSHILNSYYGNPELNSISLNEIEAILKKSL